jgi:hypothetical protein
VFEDGQFKVSRSVSTVTLSFYGGFDADDAKSFLQCFEKEVDLLESHPWSTLVFFGRGALGTPDSEKYWRYYYEFCVSRGMTHAAHANANAVIKDQIVRSSRELPIELMFCNSLSEASSWLRQHGFS